MLSLSQFLSTFNPKCNFKLVIDGENLFINKMFPNEMLIKGTINKVGFIYE